MKKIFLSLTTVLLSTLFFSGLAFGQAEDYSLPLPGGQNYDPIVKDNIINRALQESLAEGKGSQETFWDVISESSFLTRVNIAIGAIAIVWFAILASRFVISLGEEDKLRKYKQQFGWMLLGLALVSAAEFIGFRLLNPVRDLFGSTGGDGELVVYAGFKAFQIARFFFYLTAGIMLLNGLMAGYDLIIGSENEQTIEKEKTFFRSYLMAVIFIMLGEVMARIFARQDPGESTIGLLPGTTQAPQSLIDVIITEVMGLANFILTFLGMASLIMLVFASLYYITSFGNEEQMNRAKNIILGCILGIIIGISSYTISTFFAVGA